MGGGANEHAGKIHRFAARPDCFHYPRLPELDQLDPPRGPQCRMDQPRLRGGDRGKQRHPQHLQFLGHRLRHIDQCVAVCIHLHRNGAALDRRRDDRRRPHSRRRRAADDLRHRPAARPAGDPRRCHHHLPRSDRDLRDASPHRPSSAIHRHFDTAMGVLRISDEGRSRLRLFGTARPAI
jgi:hypothetical protein